MTGGGGGTAVVAWVFCPAAKSPDVSNAKTAKEYLVDGVKPLTVKVCRVRANFPTRWPEVGLDGETVPTASRTMTPAKVSTVGFTQDSDADDGVTPVTAKERTAAGRVLATMVAAFALLPAELKAKTANAYLVDGDRPVTVIEWFGLRTMPPLCPAVGDDGAFSPLA